MKKVLIVLVALVAILVIVIQLQPGAYRVERSIEVEAPPTILFAIVGDFKRFIEFSPWDGRDPNMKRDINGEGKGSSYHWSGDDNVGEGTQTIMEYLPPKKIVIDLHFVRPFEDRAITGYDIVATEKGSKVTWWMDGKNNFMAKAMSLFMDFEKMIGDDYDKGLAKLKPVAEKDAAKAAAAKKAAAEAAAEAAAAEEKPSE